MGKTNLDGLDGLNEVSYKIVQRSITLGNVHHVQLRQVKSPAPTTPAPTTAPTSAPAPTPTPTPTPTTSTDPLPSPPPINTSTTTTKPPPTTTTTTTIPATPNSPSTSATTTPLAPSTSPAEPISITPDLSTASVSRSSQQSSAPPSSVSSQNGSIDTTPSSLATPPNWSTILTPTAPIATDPSPLTGPKSKPEGPIAGGVIGGLVCLAVAGGFIFWLFRRSRAARVEGYADGYEIPRPTEENHGAEYLTGGTREDGPVNLERKRGLGNMTDINIPSSSGANGSSFPESASLSPLSRDGRPPIPATELGAPEAHGLAVVSGSVGAPPPEESTEQAAVEDNGNEMKQQEILQELRMLREEVRRFRTGGPTPEWLAGLPNDILPPEYASSPDPEMRL